METLNYSEISKSFVSFLSSKPKWYLDFKDRYYSLDEDNVFRLNNSSEKYNNISATKTTTTTEGEVETTTIDDIYDKSIVRFAVNADYQYTKAFDIVSYVAAFKGAENFTSVYFSTDKQDTNPNILPSIDNREGTYKFSIPRNNTGGKFADRMRGKYLTSSYEFSSLEGNKFSLPYITTSYRYSNI